MSERALLALFQEACAARGNWQLALSGAAVAQAEIKARATRPPHQAAEASPAATATQQPSQVPATPRRGEFNAMGAMVPNCAAAARSGGWSAAMSVLTQAWSMAREQAASSSSPPAAAGTKTLISPRHLDVRILHVALSSCTRQRQWHTAMRFIHGHLMSERLLWEAERSDIVRDAVIATASGVSNTRLAWSTALEALARCPVTADAKPVSVSTLERFLSRHGGGGGVAGRGSDTVPAPSSSAQVDGDDFSRTMAEWRNGRFSASAGADAASRLNKVVQREAEAIGKARRGLARADVLLANLQRGSDDGGPNRVPLSAGTALAIAKAADAQSHVGLAKLVLTSPSLFSHPCPPQGVIAAIHVLRRSSPNGADFVAQWFAELPQTSPHRRTFRIAALVAPLVARQRAPRQQHGRHPTLAGSSGGWENALAVLRDGPGWSHEQAAGVGLVVMRVAGEWRRALRWFIAEYYSDDGGGDRLASVAASGGDRQEKHLEILAQSGEIREQLQLSAAPAERHRRGSDRPSEYQGSRERHMDPHQQPHRRRQQRREQPSTEY